MIEKKMWIVEWFWDQKEARERGLKPKAKAVSIYPGQKSAKRKAKHMHELTGLTVWYYQDGNYGAASHYGKA